MEPVTYALATWRVAHILVHEDGPGNVAEEIRKVAGVNQWFDSPLTDRIMRDEPSVIELFSCIWCMSVWIGAIFTLVHASFPRLARAIAMPFALSAAAIIVDQLLTEEVVD